MHFFLGDRWENHNAKTIGMPSGIFFFKPLQSFPEMKNVF
jgi:hypothetical protein